jgi:hypothetical protein
MSQTWGVDDSMDDNEDMRALLAQAGTTYPMVVNIANRTLRREINDKIKEAAFDAIPDYNPGTSISEATSGYATMANAKGILSLRFQDYIYPEMAAHGVTQISSLTIDLCDGRVYRFYELFRKGSDYQSKIDLMTRVEIISRQLPMLKPFAGVCPDQEFYLTSNSLVIYYQPYVYTPGVYGVLELTLPYQEILGIIEPNGPIGRLLS